MNNHPQAVFVPWLHMHQPPIFVRRGEEMQLMGNLEKMLSGEANSEESWNARWFARAYTNPARYVEQLAKEGDAPRIMVDYSGVLLEELARLSSNGTFADLDVGGEVVGDVIALFRRVLAKHPEAIEFAGTAYSHCYFPATPERDWELQIQQWRRVFANLFGEAALEGVRGFWLPEMGMLGEPERALRLLRLLKHYGYQWLILPASTLIHPQGWPTPLLENRVHRLVVETEGDREDILCIVRDTDMGIRQQSGQNADGCLNDIRYRGQVFQAADVENPPLIVPTSDGENGNVMMFEYFNNTFAPLFCNRQQWPDIAFMTVSEYLDHFPDVTTEVRLNETGGSWIGGHDSWFEGGDRQQILEEIERLSQIHARLETSSEEAKQMLLLCETSCFVYWNSSFWFDQGKLMIERAKEAINRIAPQAIA